MPNSERFRITHARGMAYLMVEWLDTNFVIVGAEDGVELSVAGDIFYPYLARVILCLQKSKRSAEGNKVSGFENCTFKDLHHQISLAFDGNEKVTDALEACDIKTVHSMAFAEQSTYKILPRHEKRTQESGRRAQPLNYGPVDLTLASRSRLEGRSFCWTNLW